MRGDAIRATIAPMRGIRIITVALLACLSLFVAACGSSDGSDSSAKGDASTTSTTAADGGSTNTTATTDAGGSGGGSHLEASVSSGATLSTEPTVCTIDGTKGTVIADDRKFELTFADGTGDLTWTFDGGALRQSPAVTVSGSTIKLSGMTDDGMGYDAEITCA